eukprot:TRINITY_DN14852_c0_g2_i1.p1 TRINITY_DN14852_c0_g2~~TRINITY_DN14852_c0_g2_i1.p1  ORF type:complete len:349 (+),score=50.18 TRINITY_DN14852_c0_g2_i1:3-1049(+)
MSFNSPSIPSSSSPSSSFGVNYIEHRVSKMDTLAGVAIKYGVEVADIKRLNGLVTDLQMFAHKSLQIPLPGRHPPSPMSSNDSVTSGGSSLEQTPPRRRQSDFLESFQSLKLKSPQQRVSPAMCSLQGYYHLETSNEKGSAEGTEMAVYRKDGAQYLEDQTLPKTLLVSDPLPSRHRKCRSLVNDFLLEISELSDNVPVSEPEDDETKRSNVSSIRRRQKPDTDPVPHIPDLILKDESGNGFPGRTGKCLGLRPKSASRAPMAADMGFGRVNATPIEESLMTGGFAGVRKSSSTSDLHDPENGPSVRTTSKWNLKPDLQAVSTAAITRPMFDGLPKPITGRWNKAALD